MQQGLPPNKKLAKLERRAQEVIGLSQDEKDSNLLKDAAKEYKKAVTEAKPEVEKSGKKKEFIKTLEKQEKEFREVANTLPSSKDEIEEAIEASREGRNGGEVKGVKQEENEEDEKQGKDDKNDEGKQEEEEKEDRSGSNSGKNEEFDSN